MSDNIKISCQVGNTDASATLGLEIWIDNTKFFDETHVQETQTVCFEVTDDDGQHELRFVMKNKTQEHTKVDVNGNIVSDARLTVSDLAFDEIKLGHMFVDQSNYTHDFNGTGSQIVEKFYGEMGCNGAVSLKFTTPIYLWLLENM